MVDITSQTET